MRRRAGGPTVIAAPIDGAWLLVVAVLSASIASCRPAPSDRAGAERGPGPTDLAVMSFNIRYGTADDGDDAWPRRRDLVIDVIRSRDPDLLGLQEALRFQLDELAEAMPGLAEIGVGRDDGATAGEYAAILYRATRFDVVRSGTFWLSDAPEAPGSRSWGNQVTRICTWARFHDRHTGSTLSLYNVHLDHESQPSRERSVELLRRRILTYTPPGETVLVTGDFNAGESNPAIVAMRGSAANGAAPGAAVGAGDPRFLDSYRVVHPAAAQVGTFNAFRGERRGEKIDYVLVPPSVSVLSAEIVTDARDGRYPSDHFPVTARLRLNGSMAPAAPSSPRAAAPAPAPAPDLAEPQS